MGGTSGDKDLVEVTFATDDKAPRESFHTVLTLFISEKRVGMRRDVFDWAHQGGYNSDTNALEKAAKCKKLMMALDQPKDLPDSPNQIVTVRCMDGEKIVVKKFPIERVPTEVHQMLILMGCSDESLSHMNRLKFIKSPGGFGE